MNMAKKKKRIEAPTVSRDGKWRNGDRVPLVDRNGEPFTMRAALCVLLPPEDTPDARRRKHGYLWIVPVCPFCGCQHTHGGGGPEDDPRRLLTGRAAHCGGLADYLLVEGANPASSEVDPNADRTGAGGDPKTLNGGAGGGAAY
jgi:hypothetical protein